MGSHAFLTYEDIDEILLPWANEKRLAVFTTMRDQPIRLLAIRDSRGDLSVDPSDSTALVRVRAATEHERFDRIVPLAELRAALEDAYIFLKAQNG